MTTEGTTSDELAELRARVRTLEEENENLRIGLASRILVEQAKGVLIERLDLPADAVFELLRSASRRSRIKIHALAAEILQTRVTPDYITREIRHLMRGDTSDAWTRKT